MPGYWASLRAMAQPAILATLLALACCLASVSGARGAYAQLGDGHRARRVVVPLPLAPDLYTWFAYRLHAGQSTAPQVGASYTTRCDAACRQQQQDRAGRGLTAAAATAGVGWAVLVASGKGSGKESSSRCSNSNGKGQAGN